MSAGGKLHSGKTGRSRPARSVGLVYLMLFLVQLGLLAALERHTWPVVVDSMQTSLRGFGLPFGSKSPDAWFGVFAYSSLFTAIWAVLLGSTLVGLRTLSRAEKFRVAVLSHFKVDQQPLTVIGSWLAIAFIVMFALVAYASLLLN